MWKILTYDLSVSVGTGCTLPGRIDMGHLWHAFWHNTLRYIDRMDRWEWGCVLAAMLVVAFFSMRGFGSRSQY
jgi:hypothetical protein